MRSRAVSVEEYLSELTEDRRSTVETVRRTILTHLPPGYEEAMNWGMIAYQVPLATYPDTYNGEPLLYVGLAAQKAHHALYLMGIYGDAGLRRWFEDEARALDARLDIGKSCVRFRKLDDLPLDLVGRAVARLPVSEFVARSRDLARRRR